ncbi:hypothetical protein B0H10DRAFT_1962571 [Mycena sp. CBHHK59/15]|nr:hypothetical protein B0H10DRAFT_1962571 [Mycena sp. CBHHK59/15]
MCSSGARDTLCFVGRGGTRFAPRADASAFVYDPPDAWSARISDPRHTKLGPRHKLSQSLYIQRTPPPRSLGAFGGEEGPAAVADGVAVPDLLRQQPLQTQSCHVNNRVSIQFTNPGANNQQNIPNTPNPRLKSLSTNLFPISHKNPVSSHFSTYKNVTPIEPTLRISPKTQLPCNCHSL